MNKFNTPNKSNMKVLVEMTQILEKNACSSRLFKKFGTRIGIARIGIKYTSNGYGNPGLMFNLFYL